MANTITKTDLVEAVSERNGYTKRHATEVVEALLEIMIVGVKGGT